MIKRMLTFTAITTLAGCANLSGLSESYSSMTTSRMAGHWKGEQTCSTEAPGAKQTVEMKLKPSDMPLTTYGLILIERARLDNPVIGRAWVQVRGESGLNSQAVIMGQEVLKQSGPGHWVTATWNGRLIDNDTMEFSACGAPIIFKRQPEGTPSRVEL